MKNIYQKSIDLLTDTLTSAKAITLFYINIGFFIAILLQFVATAIDYIQYPEKTNSFSEYIYYNSNIVTDVIILPFLCYYIIRQYRRRKSGISEEDDRHT